MIRLSIALCLATAVPALAENPAPRPEGCRLLVTAQYSDCVVENTYYCEGAGEDHYRIEGFDAGGWNFVYAYFPGPDRDSTVFADGATVELQFDGGNIIDALEHGQSTASFRGEYREGSETYTMTGVETYEVVGELVQLSGVTFQRVQWRQRVRFDGWEGERTTRTLLYSVEHDFNLIERTEPDQAIGAEGAYLVTFALPGQPGAGRETPLQGCQIISRLGLMPGGPA